MHLTRDLELERRFTAEAAASVSGRPPTRLNDFAELRARNHSLGPILADADTRDFSREIVEELADARNYSVWWLQSLPHRQLDEHLLSDLTTAIARTLASTAIAFAHADEARNLSVDLRAA